MTMTETKHITVLLHEAVDLLDISKDSVVIDATLGAGGHAKQILVRLGKAGKYLGIDADPTAILAAESKLKGEATILLKNANFSQVKEVSDEYQLEPDAILADLGWRSEQFADAKRGFSFQVDGPLLMTYGEPANYTFTAYDIVNDWEESSIADVIFGYGEERFARRIAKAIIAARAKTEIKTTLQLVEIIQSAVPGWYRRGRLHPATKTFQALRIAVNDELGTLKTFIADGFSILKPGGRMAIITFHSLEDRLVKHSFAALKHDQQALLVNKKPITPSEVEIKSNPRARSAKLRIIEKIENHE